MVVAIYTVLIRKSKFTMPICGIYGCSNRPGVQKEFSYFKVPKIITDQGDATQKLSEERRRMWKAAINRKDIASEEKWERTIVCSKHFVGGKKAYLHDRSNPAWIPTLHLGGVADTPRSDAKTGRYVRASQRKEKKRVADAVSSLMSLKKKKIDFEQEAIQSNVPDTSCDTDLLNLSTEEEYIDESPLLDDIDNTTNCEVQTDLTGENIKQLEDDLNARIAEKEQDSFTTQNLYCFSFYEKHPDKVSFYTGMPNIEVLKLVFNLVEGYMPNDENKCLSKECEFMVCIIKMRMSYLFSDMANHLNVSVSTIQRCFHNTLNVLYSRLKFLVAWPERENLRTSMPMCFRENFGQKVVVVLDCFELFTERPSGVINKVYTYSKYKHHQTVKYLIGIAPHGVVTFISEGWGGRTSDKFITEKSGILENLLPGDVVMVDRGFSIEESVNFYQAELAIPSFTKGKKQLHPVEVEKTRKIASVRIHVERVIGHILRKFRIFEGIIPVEFIKLRAGETIPTIDKIVFVACALTNLCVSIVPFE